MSYKGLARLSIWVICGFILSLSTSCRKDLDFENTTTTLRFSQDTIFLDTIFTRSNSETYLLKVYNPSDDDISLSQIYLNKRYDSKFRINVDGLQGFEFSEVPIRANDSLMIFVEIALDQASQNFIEEDEIVFSDSNQEIKLLAMAENAEYYFPAEGDDVVVINEDTQWDSSAVRVIYGTVKVDDNSTLSITEGTRVYFHQNSSLEIEPGGTLDLRGTLDNPIIIRGDRHDTRYDTLPKQWNQIKLTQANLLANHVIVKGGTNGFNLEESYAEIRNTQIYNMSYSGIFSKNSDVYGSNVVISSAAGAGLNIEEGGIYEFYYSTFANLWNQTPAGINGPKVPVYLSNYTSNINDENGSITESFADLESTFANCIFYGDYPNGVVLSIRDEASFDYTFNSCLFKNQDLDEFNYSSDANIQNPYFGNPYFISTQLGHQDLRIQSDTESEALGNADGAFVSEAPMDIKGNLRSASNSNIGAYDN